MFTQDITRGLVVLKASFRGPKNNTVTGIFANVLTFAGRLFSHRIFSIILATSETFFVNTF